MKQWNTDQLKQKFEKLKKTAISKLVCPAQYTATSLCISQSCSKTSVFCHSIECQTCDHHRANGCQNVSLSFLFQEAKQRHSVAQKLFGLLKRQLSEAIERFEKECSTQEWVYGDLALDSKKLYQQILNQGKFSANKSVLQDLVYKLKQFKASWNQKGNSVFKSVQNKLQNLNKNIQEMKNEITLQIFSKSFQVDSIILPPKEPKWQFILQSLNFPKKLELVFRASQHSFKAASFHKKCDKVQNTFVLVLNEYNGLFGGFTPFPWNSGSGYQKKVDPKRQELLFQLSILKTMKFINNQNAVSYPNNGPVFGFKQNGSGYNKYNQYGLKISDHCNSNQNSSFSFPLDYDSNGYRCQKYKNQFYILQYEVFKVVW